MLINNRYQVIHTLGEGGFGHAYLAEDIQMPSRRRCVLKQLKPLTTNPDVYQVVKDRFQREAATLEKLGENHAQIPRLYAYFSEDQKFYLVQEWIEGQTLEAMMKDQSPQPESVVRAILLSLLPVLDFIHSQGIIHRDLKPDNIVLRAGFPLELPQPVLIDFGAVRETMGTVMNSHQSLTSSIVIGTPGYMAAEQAAGRPLPSSDLYSLGLTAIYLLTGWPPQSLASDPQSGEVIWRDRASHVSPQLVSIITRAMRSHPRDRYSSAPEMLAALAALSVGSSPSVTIPINNNISEPQQPQFPLASSSSDSDFQTVVASPAQPSNPSPNAVYSAVAASPSSRSNASTHLPSANTSRQNNSLQKQSQTVVANNLMQGANHDSSFQSSTQKPPTAVTLVLIAVGVGASLIGSGLLISHLAGDSALNSPIPNPSETLQNTPENTSPQPNSSSPTTQDDPAPAGTADVETATAETVDADVPTDAGTTSPDDSKNPSSGGQSDRLRQDLDLAQMDVYKDPGGGEPLHYGLPGDRITLLQSTEQASGIWHLVRFDSGAEGWIPDYYLAGSSSPEPAIAPPVTEKAPPLPPQVPDSATLTGAAPGSQVDVYASPSLSANSPHYGLAGDAIAILSSAPGDDGLLWYQVKFESGAAGWVRSDFVNIP